MQKYAFRITLSMAAAAGLLIVFALTYAGGQTATGLSAQTTTTSPAYKYWRVGGSGDSHAKIQAGFALIGGGQDLDAAFSWLCERSGKGDFLILRATGTDAYNPYVQSLCGNHSTATLLIPDRDAAFNPAVRKRIDSASAIFISGGDQGKYVSYWMGTPVQEAINAAIKRGVPLGGTSAGLAVQGEFMYSAQNDLPDGPDLTSDLVLSNPYSARVTIVHNFLSIPPLHGVITDTHFSRRNRMGRLLVFMARILQTNEVKKIHAIAIDEHTAFLLDPDGKGTVVGTGAAYFLEARAKASICRPNTPLTFEGISVVKLKAGDTFDTATWGGEGVKYTLSVTNGALRSTQTSGSIY